MIPDLVAPKDTRRSYPWSDPEIVAANRRGEIHPRQARVLNATNSWLIVPLLLLFTLLPCGSCVWFGANPFAGADPVRWGLFGAIAVSVVGVGIGLMQWTRCTRATMLAEPIVQGVGQVVFRQDKHNYVIEVDGQRLRSLQSPQHLPPPGTYKCYYMAASRVLLSAEPLGRVAASEVAGPLPAGADRGTTEQIQAALNLTNRFTQEELEQNRIGVISDRQRLMLRRGAVAGGVGCLAGLLITVAVVASFVWIPGSDFMRGHFTLNDAIPAAIALVFGGVTFQAFWRMRPRFGGGDVATCEGRVDKKRVGGGDGPDTFYYVCERRRFKVTLDAFNALVPGYTYRIYYAPRRMKLLSIEVLAY